MFQKELKYILQNAEQLITKINLHGNICKRQMRFKSMLMHTHMAIQVSWLRKLELANLTLVGLLSSVSPQVFGQRGAVSKSTGTYFTAVWTLSSMRTHVGGHWRGLGKPKDGTEVKIRVQPISFLFFLNIGPRMPDYDWFLNYNAYLLP